MAKTLHPKSANKNWRGDLPQPTSNTVKPFFRLRLAITYGYSQYLLGPIGPLPI